TLLLTRRAPSAGGAGAASPAFNGTASNTASPRPDGPNYTHSQPSSAAASPNLEEASLTSGAGSSSYAAKAAAFTNRSGVASTSARSGIPAWQLALPSPAESAAINNTAGAPKDDSGAATNGKVAAEAGESTNAEDSPAPAS
ncbi:hypothetical protein H4R35_006988, partial [Dimargaris xerosporica]